MPYHVRKFRTKADHAGQSVGYAGRPPGDPSTSWPDSRQIWIAEDFDETPDDLIALMESGETPSQERVSRHSVLNSPHVLTDR
jgi:hypothetical protein